MRYICKSLLCGYLILSTISNVMLSLRTRHPREIYFRLLRSVGAKNNGFVPSDARKEAGEKILPQGGEGSDRPSGGRNRFPPVGAFAVTVVLVYASRLSMGGTFFYGLLRSLIRFAYAN